MILKNENKILTGDDMTYEDPRILNIQSGQIWENYAGEYLRIKSSSYFRDDYPNFWKFDVYIVDDSEKKYYSVTAKGRFWEGEEGFPMENEFDTNDQENNLKRLLSKEEYPELYL